MHFFLTKILLLKMFVQTSTMKFWQACRNFVARNTKNFPELENRWKYIFSNKIILFIRNVSLATENAISTTTPKNSSELPTDLPFRFQKMTRKFMNFSKENYFSSNCASVHVERSCDQPVKTFSSKLWRLFAGIPEMTKNW